MSLNLFIRNNILIGYFVFVFVIYCVNPFSKKKNSNLCCACSEIMRVGDTKVTRYSGFGDPLEWTTVMPSVNPCDVSMVLTINVGVFLKIFRSPILDRLHR